jgi:hypothetical protein
MIALLVLLAVADGAADVPDAGTDASVDGAVDVQAEIAADAGTDLPSLGRLHGQVFAKGSRTPLAAASLTIDVSPAGETDEDGRFDVTAPCGSHHLTVQAPGSALLTIVRDPCGDPGPLVLRLPPQEGGPIYQTVVVATPERPTHKLTGPQLTQVPGAMGDPLRVLDSLPGVASPVWPVPIYAVRGANPGNTGFLLDDLRIPALFHMALGPAVIHPYFFDSLSFYPGGYPARYGRYAAGLVTAQTRAPAEDAVHAAVDVRLYDAGGLVSAPLPGGGGIMAAARYSYTGALVSRFDPNVRLGYWDYQLRADRPVGRARLTLLLLGARDTLTADVKTHPDREFVQAFHRVQLRGRLPLGPGVLSAALAAGVDNTRVPLSDVVRISVEATSLTPRVSYRVPTGRVDWEAGLDGEVQWLSPLLDVEQPGYSDLARERQARLFAGYASATIRATTRFTVTPELRLDTYAISGASKADMAPRLTARLVLDDKTWLAAHAGRFTQTPSLPLQLPGVENFGLALYGLQTAWQGAVTVGSKRLTGFEVELTGYVQRYVLTDLRDALVVNPNPMADDFLVRRDALSYGAEVMIRRPLSERLYGWLAYTLSNSLRAMGGGVVGPSDWDQRHIFNLVLGYRWGLTTFGTRAHYNTGRPVLVQGSVAEEFKRLPGYFQIDWRIDRRILFDTFRLDVYAELVNSMLSRSVFSRSQDVTGRITEDAYRIVLPSVGVHGEF